MMPRVAVFSILALLSGCETVWEVGDLDGDGVSQLDGDCWDKEKGPPGSGLSGKDIHPGARETWYDGFDQDCGSDDDFDADGDGWVPLEEHVGKPTFGVRFEEGTGPGAHLGWGDCFDAPDSILEDASALDGYTSLLDLPVHAVPADVDTDESGNPYVQLAPSEVNPGVTSDLFYDGIDADCDGGDDFDQDDDGYSTQYHARPDGSTGDDCIDDSWRDDENLAGTPPDEVNPGEEENFWDGTDQDCTSDLLEEDPTPDCDKDLDGYRGDPNATVLEDSPCQFDLAGGELVDCNDEEPTAYPQPELEEDFFDGVDNNCSYVNEDGLPDLDGDEDRDGYFDRDYCSRVPGGCEEVGPTVIVPNLEEDFDCWDDPEADPATVAWPPDAPAGFGTMEALAGFDPLVSTDVNSAAVDRPYDGVDQDCQGWLNGHGAAIDFDWDGDGDQVEIDYTDDGSGLRGGDCLDCPDSCFNGDASAEAQVHCDAYCGDQDSNPAGTTTTEINSYVSLETWYNGTDEDCDDWSDFDADRDGFDHEMFGGTDCFEDTWVDIDTPSDSPDPATYNTAATENWYDGNDQDCDDWSDYDADYDGFDHEEYGGTDCWEGAGADVDVNLAGLDPDQINTDATETWYDGTDADCDDRSDFDADRDGYDHEAFDGDLDRFGDVIDGTDCWEGAGASEDNNLGGLAATAINPGVTETWYDGTDADCDDWSDYDQDRDTYDSEVYDGVVDRFGVAVDGTDCDDTSTAFRPDAVEGIGDSIDQNCNDQEICYDDDDNDGQLDATGDTRLSTTDADCNDPYEGTDTEATTDCDDSDPGDYLGATEVVGNQDDEDCNGGEICYDDDDNDGYLDTSADTIVSADTDCLDVKEGTNSDPTTDCDDTDSGDYPGATELVGNSDDESCDGTEICYDDDDNDGYLDTSGDTRVSTNTVCTDAYEGTTSDPTTDCDDTDPGDYPGSTEIVGNQDDEDCNGGEICYDDDDNDGYLDTSGDTRASTDTDCTDAYEGTTSDPTTDCDDADSGDYPSATEIVGNSDDESCDGTEICFHDDDNDGYLDTSADTIVSTNTVCTDAYEGTTGDPTTDCDDLDSGDYPGATEIVGNGDDESCDGTEICFDDDDNDGYLDTSGDTRASTDTDCSDNREGTTSDPTTDCDDNDSGDYPGAPETVGNGDDEDCDGGEICYDDDDNDGYLDSSGDTRTSSDADCSDTYEGTTSDPTTDCNDADGTIYPGATELPGDEVNQDCTTGELCYVDSDSDGYRPTSGSSTVASADNDCGDAGEGLTSEPATDCNDSDSTINPAATELPGDEVNQDCTTGELCWVDADSDGYRPTSGSSTVASADNDCGDAGEGLTSEPATDCNDSSSSINPGATETCDGIDNDCDGDIDDDDSSVTGTTDYYPDGDGDGFGEEGSTAEGYCSQPSGYSETDDDCDDTNADVNPDGDEGLSTDPPDALDNDCDGYYDEVQITVGDLLITELMADPNTVADSVGEWIEIYNNSGYDLVLGSGWTLQSGTASHTITGTLEIADGAYLVFARNAVASTTHGLPGTVTVAWEWGSGGSSDVAFNNAPTNDSASLVFNDGSSSTTITSVEWNRSSSPTVSITAGYAINLDFDGTTLTYPGSPTPANWCNATAAYNTSGANTDYGTPGSDNRDCP